MRDFLRTIAPCLLLLALAVGAASAAETLQAGRWTVAAGPGGAASIAYDGTPLARDLALQGFLPEWKGTHFSLAGATVTKTSDSLTWTKQSPTQDATLLATAAGTRLAIDLETTVRAAGPVEYSLQIIPEAVRTTDKYALISVNGKPRTLDLLAPFDHLGGVTELRFEQLERTVVVRCDQAQVQDRRDRNGGFFLVFVFDGKGQAVTEKRHLEIEVQEPAPEDREARRATMSQIAMEKQEIAVPNAGFEEGLKQWGDNPRATVDTAVKHGGKQSARIRIPADQTDRTGIYLVQNVPVIGGRVYSVEGFLRSEDVKGVSLGEMSPTGVTIILEWADKDGKWLAAGDYAPGLYGTKDWTRVSTKLMRSPQDAGFAIIFLALRGTGTGWFDDLEMTEVTRHVVLRGPLFGKSLADNTPEFSWQLGEPGAARLELSPDETFPAATTVRYEDLQSPFSPDKPLAPGKWYWRVTVPEHGTTSVAWQFTQTAPLTQDCSAPAIAADHGYLTGARSRLVVHYRDNVAVTKADLRLDGRPVTGKVEAERVTYAPAQDWTPGLHKLEVTATDAAGNAAQRTVFFNYAPGVVKKEWLVNGGIALDGKPQFLLGMYGVRTEDIPEMAAAGYDFVHNYTWDGNGTNASALAYLDACQAHGLQAFIGFDRNKLRAWDEEFVAERVGALSRHPALLAWYLFDEPDLPHQYVPPDQLRALYRLIHELDPKHPVIVTVAQGNFMPRYRGSYDVYWSMDYGTPAANVKNLEYHRDKLEPGVPIMSIVHSYDGKQKGPEADPAKFAPGPAQLRACAFMAIAHNSSGLCWWWWGQGSNAFLTVAHVPAAWAALKETVRQIRDLRPVLEAQVPSRTWVEKPAEEQEVHFWEKTVGGRTVIIAVNRDQKPTTVAVSSPALAGKQQATVLYESRTAPVQDGKISDSFEPWAVHVYEVK